MKILSLTACAIFATPAFVHSQEKPSIATPATARIIGDIPDGTPPPPEPPKIPFIVASKDILSTATHEQGGRTITVQRIKPIALPQPAPPPQAIAESEPATRQRFAEFKEDHRDSDILFLGATVFRFKDSPPRTLVNYWPGGNGEQITFWSSADFALLAGVSQFTSADGQDHSLFLMWSAEEIDRTATLSAASEIDSVAADIPAFPEGKATFILTGKPPAAETLASIQSLHDLYNNEHERLKTAHEGRERARLQQEAELKAHPPKPKDIVLNYWRIEKPVAVKGGAK